MFEFDYVPWLSLLSISCSRAALTCHLSVIAVPSPICVIYYVIIDLNVALFWLDSVTLLLGRIIKV